MNFESFKEQFNEIKNKHTIAVSELNVKFANEINEFTVVNIEKVFIPGVTMLENYDDRSGYIRYLVLGIDGSDIIMGAYCCNGDYNNPYYSCERTVYKVNKALQKLTEVKDSSDVAKIKQAVKYDETEKKERNLKKYKEAMKIVKAFEASKKGGAIK